MQVSHKMPFVVIEEEIEHKNIKKTSSNKNNATEKEAATKESSVTETGKPKNKLIQAETSQKGRVSGL